MAAYNSYQVEGTKHTFSAPKAKYENVKDDLGLKDVTADDAAREQGLKLAPGYGYVRLVAVLKKSGNKPRKSVDIICAPSKVGTAILNGLNNQINGQDVDRIYVPTNRYRK
jgi:hypothetical protein